MLRPIYFILFIYSTFFIKVGLFRLGFVTSLRPMFVSNLDELSERERWSVFASDNTSHKFLSMCVTPAHGH